MLHYFKLKEYKAINTTIVHCIYLCNSFRRRIKYLKTLLQFLEYKLLFLVYLAYWLTQ